MNINDSSLPIQFKNVIGMIQLAYRTHKTDHFKLFENVILQETWLIVSKIFYKPKNTRNQTLPRSGDK